MKLPNRIILFDYLEIKRNIYLVYIEEEVLMHNENLEKVISKAIILNNLSTYDKIQDTIYF